MIFQGKSDKTKKRSCSKSNCFQFLSNTGIFTKFLRLVVILTVCEINIFFANLEVSFLSSSFFSVEPSIKGI